MCYLWKDGVWSESFEELKGKGSKAEPYLISNAGDLRNVADLVNMGNRFEGRYFLQTDDIDLESAEWTVIAPYESDCYFDGIYNGGGHCIRNLSVHTDGNSALFGKLGGTVMNLGIESGEIQGVCAGSIASHASGTAARIINCYSKAAVKGVRAGGIADNFNGTIANCWTDCELTADTPDCEGGIVSYAAAKMQNCYSIETGGRNSGRFEGCMVIDKNAFRWDEVAERLNSGLYDSAATAGIRYDDLYTWTAAEDGSLRFGKTTAKFSVLYLKGFLYEHMMTAAPYIIMAACLAGSGIIVFGKPYNV